MDDNTGRLVAHVRVHERVLFPTRNRNETITRASPRARNARRVRLLRTPCAFLYVNTSRDSFIPGRNNVVY